jgi:hypothetical protein
MLIGVRQDVRVFLPEASRAAIFRMHRIKKRQALRLPLHILL